MAISIFRYRQKICEKNTVKMSVLKRIPNAAVRERRNTCNTTRVSYNSKSYLFIKKCKTLFVFKPFQQSGLQRFFLCLKMSQKNLRCRGKSLITILSYWISYKISPKFFFFGGGDFLRTPNWQPFIFSIKSGGKMCSCYYRTWCKIVWLH